MQYPSSNASAGASALGIWETVQRPASSEAAATDQALSDALHKESIRIGIGCTIPFQISHIAILLLRFRGFAASAVPMLFADLVLTAMVLAWTWRPSFNQAWRSGLLAWGSVLVFTATAINFVTGQNVIFYATLTMMILGFAAFAPWGARWQAFFTLGCLGAAAVAARVVPDSADPFEPYRLLELTTAALIGLFVATLTERYRHETALRIRTLEASEEAVGAASDAARSASAAKSAFLSAMSHEIRTPMNAIIGMAEVLAESPLAAEQRKYLSIMVSNGNALLDLIDDILDFARIESGKLKLERTEFDPVELAERVAETLSVRAHAKQLELVVKIAPDIPIMVAGDPLRLRQVLVNLVGNAIKFTETGEVVLEISRGKPPETLHFVVRDTGIGIPAARREAIFKIFEQADSSTARNYGGSGLGLAIAAQLAGLMGGRVWVDSEVGRGSAFHFVARFDAPEKSVSENPLHNGNLAGINVLVVDDNSSSREAIAAGLAVQGANVTAAAGGIEGLDLISRAEGTRYQAILLDCGMPGIDGIETVRRMASEGLDVAKVIPLLTSDELSTKLPLLREFGLHHHLIKPVRRSELIQAIAESAAAPAGPAEPEADLQSACISPTESNGCTPGNSAEPGDSITNNPFGRPLRVLVADDSEDNRLLIEAFLKKAGCRLDHADNGEEAVQKFAANHYDVVLMDIRMPVLDGYRAVRQIRDWEREQGAAHTPVIALTASVLDEAVGKSFQAGCDNHVSKPVRRNTLVAAIQEVIAP